MQRCQCLCCGARLAALTFPLAPFLSLTGRRRGRIGWIGCGVNLASPTRHVQRLALTAQQRERVAGGGTERWPPNPVVAQARYFPMRNPGFCYKERFPGRSQPVRKHAAFRSDGSLRSDPRCLADHTRHHTMGRLSTCPYPICDMASSAGGLGSCPYKTGTGVIGETNRGWIAHSWDRKQYTSARAVGELGISPFLSSHYLYRAR